MRPVMPNRGEDVFRKNNGVVLRHFSLKSILEIQIINEFTNFGLEELVKYRHVVIYLPTRTCCSECGSIWMNASAMHAGDPQHAALFHRYCGLPAPLPDHQPRYGFRQNRKSHFFESALFHGAPPTLNAISRTCSSKCLGGATSERQVTHRHAHQLQPAVGDDEAGNEGSPVIGRFISRTAHQSNRDANKRRRGRGCVGPMVPGIGLQRALSSTPIFPTHRAIASLMATTTIKTSSVDQWGK